MNPYLVVFSSVCNTNNGTLGVENYMIGVFILVYTKLINLFKHKQEIGTENNSLIVLYGIGNYIQFLSTNNGFLLLWMS